MSERRPVAVSVHPSLDAAGQAGVARLASAAAAHDGVEPLGEHVLLALGGSAATHLMVSSGSTLVGYAQVDPAGPSVELVVHPDHRRRGVGRALAGEVLESHPDARGWAHGTLPGAVVLAEQLGLRQSRRLLVMTRELTGELPAQSMPAGIRLRSFLPGLDDDEWLAVNARAFTELPDQGGWTRPDLAARTSQPWFDPAGFLIAVDRTGAMVGFHWTKVHERGTSGGGHEHVGEVYVVGVDPSQRGRGLGRALTVAGLHHLQQTGLRTVLLYVDAANTAAVQLYASLGFALDHADTEYAAG